MMKKMFILVSVLLCGYLLAGCHGGLFSRRVRTSDNVETKKYDIIDFTGLTVKGDMEQVNLELEQGSYEVSIEADSNYINELEVEKRGDNLRISLDKNRYFTKPITIKVSAPALSALEIQGAMKLSSLGQLQGNSLGINIEGAAEVDLDLDYNSLDMRVAGAAQAELFGSADDLTISCEGAADINAKRLQSKNAKVSIAGAAEVDVNCSDYLDASIEGAGTIEYTGNPKVEKHIAGLGEIKRE